MKLYTTVTSERATKGQGGEWLDLEIMGHNKVVIARVLVRTSLEHGYTIEVFPVAYPDLLKIDVKGHGYRLKRILSDREKSCCSYSNRIKGLSERAKIGINHEPGCNAARKDDCKFCKGLGLINIGFTNKVDCDNCNGTGKGEKKKGKQCNCICHAANKGVCSECKHI